MHISTDIETFGSGDDAQILQISAVAFELNGVVLDPHELLQYDDRWFDACIEPYYGSAEQSNCTFWHAPEQADALARIKGQPQVSIDAALDKFTSFVGRWLGKRGSIWAHPVTFDLRILRGAYREAKRKTPWEWSQEQELRTLLWAAKKVPRTNFRVPDMSTAGFVKHYALHDAVVQAIQAQAAFRALSLTAAQSPAATVV